MQNDFTAVPARGPNIIIGAEDELGLSPESFVPEYVPIGATVKKIRKQRALTLSDLAKKSGLSVSAVSKIENHRISPTYETILRLANGLDIHATGLFTSTAARTAAGRMVVTRKGEGRRAKIDSHNCEILGSEFLRKQFTPILRRIPARPVEDMCDYQQHWGEEFIHVISGEVMLYTEYYSPVHLCRGDSSYYDATMRHALISVSEEDAFVMCITVATLLPPQKRRGARADVLEKGENLS
ncbi:helix-turn-helix domain-containing protein [Rhizobium leguminosarum]|uniref:helix-turn-helix domain-containing protein n=1 Tax=Rhizobium leguminosarum TaxID=384 RepID=UPI00067EDCCB|nr:XRE family transcriptional regulator [Rhizobium leguminosarum]WFT91050.1 XRE family transcriptional regulator [Rhizobium leguminosarum]